MGPLIVTRVLLTQRTGTLGDRMGIGVDNLVSKKFRTGR